VVPVISAVPIIVGCHSAALGGVLLVTFISTFVLMLGLLSIGTVAFTPRCVLMPGLRSIGTSALGLPIELLPLPRVKLTLLVVAAAAAATAAAVVAIGRRCPIPRAMLLVLLASMTFIHVLGVLFFCPSQRFGGTPFVGAGLGAITL
jgi:hypothetical protein